MSLINYQIPEIFSFPLASVKIKEEAYIIG